MKIKSTSLALMSFFLFAHLAIGANPQVGLKVEISVGEDAGFLNYTLKNVSNTEIQLGMMSCSVWDHWVIESKEVVLSWPSPICDKNYCSPKKIGVASSIKGVLPIQKLSNSQKDVLIQVGFMPCTPLRSVPPGINNVDHLLNRETYWSNSLKVKIKSLSILEESDKGRLNIRNKPPGHKGGIHVESKVHCKKSWPNSRLVRTFACAREAQPYLLRLKYDGKY